MKQPLVSICTPTYDRPLLLGRAIRSVLAQTCQDFEIVITDNSENDESTQVVRGFNDPRIRYCHNGENIGNLNNIKKVAGLAEGTYLVLLLDDDLLKPQALQLMLAAFGKYPSVGVVMAPMDLIDSNDRRIFPRFYLVRKMHYRYRYQVGDGLVDRATVLKEFLVHDYPCCVPSGIMYRVEAVRRAGGFDTRSDFALDLDLDMRIAVHHDFYYIDQVLSSFRYTPISLTSTMHATGGQRGGVLLHHAQNPGRPGGDAVVCAIGAKEAGAGQPLFLFLPRLAAQRHGGSAGAPVENHRRKPSG